MQIALIEPIANSTRAITGLRQDRGEGNSPGTRQRRRIRNVPEPALEASRGPFLKRFQGIGWAAERCAELVLINQRKGNEKSPARMGGAREARRFPLGGDYRHDFQRHRIDDHDLILVIEEPVVAVFRNYLHQEHGQGEQVEVPGDPYARPKIEVDAAHPESIEPIPVTHEHVVNAGALLRGKFHASPLSRKTAPPIRTGCAETLIALGATGALIALFSGGAETFIALATAEALVALRGSEALVSLLITELPGALLLAKRLAALLTIGVAALFARLARLSSATALRA